MLNYLDQNSGALLAILTAIYVIATIGMFIAMLHSNKLVRENIRTILKMETERQRPLVYFDLTTQSVFVMAKVRNVGLTAAYDVKIEVSPKITVQDRLRNGEINLTERTLGFLAPEREIEEFVEGFPQFIQNYPELKFNGKIKYRNSANQWYEDEIHLDLSIHKHRHYLGMKNVADEIANLNDTLKEITRNFPKS